MSRLRCYGAGFFTGILYIRNINGMAANGEGIFLRSQRSEVRGQRKDRKDRKDRRNRTRMTRFVTDLTDT